MSTHHFFALSALFTGVFNATVSADDAQNLEQDSTEFVIESALENIQLDLTLSLTDKASVVSHNQQVLDATQKDLEPELDNTAPTVTRLASTPKGQAE